ncbi:MAG: HNH endonuclease domain-containing protein [[Ruminococcus] lactaris]
MINYIYIIRRKADVCIPVSRSISEDLWDNTKYDIDHIYPQSKTMDDSLKNRVLVKKNTMPKNQILIRSQQTFKRK